VIERKVLRVRDVVRVLADRVRATSELRDIWVEGEVSSASSSPQGHVYFALKDVDLSLQCMLSAERAANVPVLPRTGQRVVAHGSLDIFGYRSVYQLLVDDVAPAGLGEAHARLEALRRRLQAEGVFDAARKRALPRPVRRIGVVTSPGGAAWRDIQTVVVRRDPRVEIVLAPAQVQGGGAADSLIAALTGLAMLRGLDAIIVARGGGAPEELAPFNDEGVVRAVQRAAVPVVSGVGHESDTTLVDFAADVRAPTPSVAAELLVPDARAGTQALDRAMRRVAQRAEEAVRRRRTLVVAARRVLDRRAPRALLAGLRRRSDESASRIERALARITASRRASLTSARRRLEALSPFNVVSRGYAIVEDADGRVRTDAKSFAPGDGATVRLRDGRVVTRVEKIE
jgi:exodeoxyribonuclease VII large subunit